MSEGSTSGGQLRQQLEDFKRQAEESQSENDALRQKIATFESANLIQENGFELVKPEDLVSVPEQERAAKAAEIEASRQEEQVNTVRQLLASKQGLSGEALDAAVAQIVEGTPPASSDAATVADMRGISQIGGSSPAAESTKNLHGLDAIRAGLSG